MGTREKREVDAKHTISVAVKCRRGSGRPTFTTPHSPPHTFILSLGDRKTLLVDVLSAITVTSLTVYLFTQLLSRLDPEADAKAKAQQKARATALRLQAMMTGNVHERNSHGSHSLIVSCHCNAVRLAVPRTPEYLNVCRCSICRRYAASWGYYKPEEVTFLSPKPSEEEKSDPLLAGINVQGTRAYTWGDKQLAFTYCETCGCMMYWWAFDGGDEVGVNMSCVEDVEALKGVEKRITYDAAAAVRHGQYDENGPLRR